MKLFFYVIEAQSQFDFCVYEFSQDVFAPLVEGIGWLL